MYLCIWETTYHTRREIPPSSPSFRTLTQVTGRISDPTKCLIVWRGLSPRPGRCFTLRRGALSEITWCTLFACERETWCFGLVRHRLATWIARSGDSCFPFRTWFCDTKTFCYGAKTCPDTICPAFICTKSLHACSKGEENQLNYIHNPITQESSHAESTITFHLIDYFPWQAHPCQRQSHRVHRGSDLHWL